MFFIFIAWASVVIWQTWWLGYSYLLFRTWPQQSVIMPFFIDIYGIVISKKSIDKNFCFPIKMFFPVLLIWSCIGIMVPGSFLVVLVASITWILSILLDFRSWCNWLKFIGFTILSFFSSLFWGSLLASSSVIILIIIVDALQIELFLSVYV